MSMSREDVLRALDLLPVWRLRASIPQQSIVKPPELPLVEARESIVEEQVQVETQPAVYITSDDQKWTFVLPAELTGQAAELFNHILQALGITLTQTTQSQHWKQDLARLNVGVVVVMGETIAQQMFATTQSLESLRGTVHVMDGLQVLATYHPNELLQYLPNKAKTWDDLCRGIDALVA